MSYEHVQLLYEASTPVKNSSKMISNILTRLQSTCSDIRAINGNEDSMDSRGMWVFGQLGGVITSGWAPRPRF